MTNRKTGGRQNKGNMTMGNVSIEGDEDRWISKREALRLLGVGASKLRELRNGGALKEERLGYRTLRFSLKSVRALIRNRSKPKRSRGAGE
jgi:hypothetical protein